MNALIIQVGNTSTKWATFCGEELLEKGRVFDFENAELFEKHQEYDMIFFSCEASEQLKSKFQLAYPKAQETSRGLRCRSNALSRKLLS